MTMYSIGSLGGQVLRILYISQYITVDFFYLLNLTCDVSVGAGGDRHEGDGGWRGQRQVSDRSRAHDPIVQRLQNSLFYMYDIQHCFVCHPSDSTVSKDAGIEPRTVATIRHLLSDSLATRLDLILIFFRTGVLTERETPYFKIAPMLKCC
jgi:hypothetical protein